MPAPSVPDTPHDLIVARTIDVGVGITVELRVPRSTAEAWCPHLWRDVAPHYRDERWLAAAADKRARRLVLRAVREGRITAGHWRATFTGGHAVELEPAT